MRSICLSMMVVTGLVTTQTWAEETQYVSDSSYIPLRTGQTNQHRIRMNLKAGDKLTVMETSEDTQWARVVTEGGTDGWVQSQYLTKEAPAKLQLEYATQKLARVEQQLQELKQKNRELNTSNSELTRNVSTESQSRNDMAAELQKIRTLSADAIALEQRYRELEQKNGLLTTQAEKLSAENTKLKDDQRVDFMLVGTGILLCGVLLAIIVPALKPKKRQSEWR
jgi:SH3 domain protein